MSRPTGRQAVLNASGSRPPLPERWVAPCQQVAGTAIRSAWPPPPTRAMFRSPGLTAVTALPIAVTSPATSGPGVDGHPAGADSFHVPAGRRRPARRPVFPNPTSPGRLPGRAAHSSRTSRRCRSPCAHGLSSSRRRAASRSDVPEPGGDVGRSRRPPARARLDVAHRGVTSAPAAAKARAVSIPISEGRAGDDHPPTGRPVEATTLGSGRALVEQGALIASAGSCAVRAGLPRAAGRDRVHGVAAHIPGKLRATTQAADPQPGATTHSVA